MHSNLLTITLVFCDDHGEDTGSLVNCIMNYINFCVDNAVPAKTILCFANSKPWITRDKDSPQTEKESVHVRKQGGADKAENTVTGGRWRTNCSRTMSVESARVLEPSLVTENITPRLQEIGSE